MPYEDCIRNEYCSYIAIYPVYCHFIILYSDNRITHGSLSGISFQGGEYITDTKYLKNTYLRTQWSIHDRISKYWNDCMGYDEEV